MQARQGFVFHTSPLHVPRALEGFDVLDGFSLGCKSPSTFLHIAEACNLRDRSQNVGATARDVFDSVRLDGSYRKLGVPHFGVLIIRILLFRVLY